MLSENAIPNIFPHLSSKSNVTESEAYFNDAIKVRKTVETILDDHQYFGIDTDKDDLDKSTPSNIDSIFETIDSTGELEIESSDHNMHKKSLENIKLKALLQQHIQRIENLEREKELLKEKNRMLEEEKANGFLPKELFQKIFGEDQIKFLQKGRVQKWSDLTIKKALKLRFAAGTRGK